MATKTSATKDFNGAVDSMADIATKSAEDARAAVQTVTDIAAKATEDTKAVWADVTAKATEETKAVLASNQKAWEDGFKAWQEYTQFYADFAFKTTQQSLEQSLAFREKWSKLMMSAFKQTQDVGLREQQFVLEAVEEFQSQAQVASDRFAKTFNPILLNK